MDYEKTVQLYEKAGQMKRWENEPESFSYNSEKKWFDKVRSKRNGEFYQAQDLINRELVPPEWEPPHVDAKGKPVKYPLKYVNSIIRVRAKDGNEYLKSRQQWWGLDEAGNPINQTMDDKEVMDEIRPIYKLRPENPKARDSKMIREVESISHSTKYLLPFSAEAAEKLWNMRNGNCTLILKDESKGDKYAYSVESFEHFKSREFDELFQWISTPKYKMDRSYGDRLDDTGVH
jgi:hypothetical protein